MAAWERDADALCAAVDRAVQDAIKKGVPATAAVEAVSDGLGSGLAKAGAMKVKDIAKKIGDIRVGDILKSILNRIDNE